MPQFEMTRRVQHRAENMYALVADVEKYPQFLPMCEALTIRSRKEKDGKTLLLADMTVGYKLIKETFTTQVLLKPDDVVIDVKYVDGPFRYLDNKWAFHSRDEGRACDVEFFVDYVFKSRALGLIMGSMFEIAFRKFTEAFEKRADEIYGRN